MDALRDNPNLKPFLLSNVRFTGTKIGAGAYGSVEEVAIPGAICAAKKIHDFFQDTSQIPKADISKASSRFVKECQLMSTLRHPNIVQFLGVCFFPGSRLPALVMERLLTSLHDLLDPDIDPPPPPDAPKPFFPLTLKCSILHNVASGLAYLHDRSPPIIHRDLSARNVLLNSGMVAKIADLGVARIVPHMRGAATMTKAPGASVYMPPEAMEDKAEQEKDEEGKTSKYDASIDVFSFGVVSIFTLSQTFPCKLLASTYREGRTHIARTELKRRERYMRMIYSQLREQHPLLQMIERCLDFPEDRPSIGEVLRLLEQARAEDRDELTEMSKLELLSSNQSLGRYLQSRVQEVTELQQELMRKQAELTRAEETIQQKDKELAQAQQQIQEMKQQETELVQDRELAQTQQQLREKETELVQAKDSELAQAQQQLREKETELVQTKDSELAQPLREKEVQLRSSKAPVADYQKNLQQKDSESLQKMATRDDHKCIPSSLTPRQLSLPGRTLPPALPLIISCQDNWNSVTCELETAKGAQDHSLKLVQDALELLRSIDKPLAVLSICGPYRSGKSYFMSRLLGSAGAFKLGHSMQACTRGIWMATTVLECDEFATILLDTEGIDAVGASETMAMCLLTLTTLLSSYFIYNSKKVPKKGDLDKMRCFSQLSTSLLAQRGESMTSEAMKKFFPHFLWLLRDVSLKMTNKEGEMITPTEYLHTRLLTAESGELTELGESLFSLFPCLECSTLPIASSKANVIRNIVEQQDKLNPAFNIAVNELIQRILQQMSPKKAIDGICLVTGSKLAALACGYVEAVNTPGALPDLEQGWQAVVRLELKEYSDELVREYTRRMESCMEGSLPMEEEHLMKIHEETMKWRKSSLVQEIRRINPLRSSDEDVMPFISQLENAIVQWSEPDEKGKRKVVGGVLFQYTIQNYAASKEECEMLMDHILYESGLQECINEAIMKSAAIDLDKEIEELMDHYKLHADGPAANEVLEKGVVEFNNYKAQIKEIPGIPQNLTLVGLGPDRMKIRWTPPKYNPDAVEHYVVSKRFEGGKWEEVVRTKRTAALITELKSNKTYDIKVVATNPLITGLEHSGLCETKSKVASAAVGAGVGVLLAPAYIGKQIIENADQPLSTAKQCAVYGATIPLSFLIFPVVLTISAAKFAQLNMEDNGDLTPVKEY